jgi:hypothetical protein
VKDQTPVLPKTYDSAGTIMSKRHFNIAGPCVPGEHYMLDARSRCGDLMELIDERKFFVIHAARQSAKTTLLNSLEQELNAGDHYHALYC